MNNCLRVLHLTSFYASTSIAITEGWEQLPDLPAGKTTAIVHFNGDLHASSDSGFFKANSESSPWQKRSLAGPFLSLCVFGENLVGADNSGKFFTSGDSGTTWTTLPSPFQTTGDMGPVFIGASNKNLWVWYQRSPLTNYGKYAGLYKTVDLKIWHSVIPDSGTYVDSFDDFYPSGDKIYITKGFYPRYSADEGSTWNTFHFREFPSDKTYQNGRIIRPLVNDFCWLVQSPNQNHLWFWSNARKNFRKSPIDLKTDSVQVVMNLFIDSNAVFSAGRSQMAVSLDKGLTWNDFSIGIGSDSIRNMISAPNCFYLLTDKTLLKRAKPQYAPLTKGDTVYWSDSTISGFSPLSVQKDRHYLSVETNLEAYSGNSGRLWRADTQIALQSIIVRSESTSPDGRILDISIKNSVLRPFLSSKSNKPSCIVDHSLDGIIDLKLLVDHSGKYIYDTSITNKPCLKASSDWFPQSWFSLTMDSDIFPLKHLSDTTNDFTKPEMAKQDHSFQASEYNLKYLIERDVGLIYYYENKYKIAGGANAYDLTYTLVADLNTVSITARENAKVQYSRVKQGKRYRGSILGRQLPFDLGQKEKKRQNGQRLRKEIENAP